MPQIIGKYGPISTSDEAFVDGFNTGKEWTRDYTPGGPFIFKAINKADFDWKEYCRASELNNTEWLRGFRLGLDERNIS